MGVSEARGGVSLHQSVFSCLGSTPGFGIELIIKITYRTVSIVIWIPCRLFVQNPYPNFFVTGLSKVYPQSTYIGRDETGSVYLPTSWSVHCNFTGEGKCSERGWACTPPPLPARANFTLITECTPESSGCNSVYSVVLTAFPKSATFFKVFVQMPHSSTNQEVM